MAATKLGFIGLGNMGGFMAKNLMKKGHPLVVYDVSKDSIQPLKEAGAHVAGCPAEVASEVTRIVSMVPESSHVREVYTGTDGLFRSSWGVLITFSDSSSYYTTQVVSMVPESSLVREVFTETDGLFSTVQTGSLFMDCSTIDPAVSKEMAELAEQKGASFVDAPVSGGVPAARDGGLTFMVGGTESAFQMATEYLNCMGKNIVHCGDVGTGQAAKICNNMLLGISMIGASETMNLGMRLGLDPVLLAKILNMSSGRCWSTEVYNPVPGVKEGVPSSNDYKGGFGTALMTKDLGLAQNAATANKAATPLGSMAHQIYRTMTNHGFGGKDFSSAFLFLQDQDKKN